MARSVTTVRIVITTVNPTVLRVIPSYIGIYVGLETVLHGYFLLFPDIPEQKHRSLRLDPAHSPKPAGITGITHRSRNIPPRDTYPYTYPWVYHGGYISPCTYPWVYHGGYTPSCTYPGYTSLGTPCPHPTHDCTGVRCMQRCPSRCEDALGSRVKKPMGEEPLSLPELPKV